MVRCTDAVPARSIDLLFGSNQIIRLGIDCVDPSETKFVLVMMRRGDEKIERKIDDFKCR